MSIKAQLIADMKQAMKNKDQVKLSVVRFLRAEIKNFEIDNGEQDDAGVEKIIARQVKQVKEAIDEYQKAGRTDLVAAETPKLEVLESYLPEQLTDEDLQKIVAEVLATLDNPKLGPAIGQVMKKVNGRASGQRVSAMVKQALS